MLQVESFRESCLSPVVPSFPLFGKELWWWVTKFNHVDKACLWGRHRSNGVGSIPSLRKGMDICQPEAGFWESVCSESPRTITGSFCPLPWASLLHLTLGTFLSRAIPQCWVNSREEEGISALKKLTNYSINGKGAATGFTG